MHIAGGIILIPKIVDRTIKKKIFKTENKKKNSSDFVDVTLEPKPNKYLLTLQGNMTLVTFTMFSIP